MHPEDNNQPESPAVNALVKLATGNVNAIHTGIAGISNRHNPALLRLAKQTSISYLELEPVTALEDGGSGYRHLQELVGCDRVVYLGIQRFCHPQLPPNSGTTSRGRSIIINNNGEFLSVT